MIARVRWHELIVGDGGWTIRPDCIEFEVGEVNFPSEMMHWKGVARRVIEALEDGGMTITFWRTELQGKGPIPRFPSIVFN